MFSVSWRTLTLKCFDGKREVRLRNFQLSKSGIFVLPIFPFSSGCHFLYLASPPLLSFCWSASDHLVLPASWLSGLSGFWQLSISWTHRIPLSMNFYFTTFDWLCWFLCGLFSLRMRLSFYRFPESFCFLHHISAKPAFQNSGHFLAPKDLKHPNTLNYFVFSDF